MWDTNYNQRGPGRAGEGGRDKPVLTAQHRKRRNSINSARSPRKQGKPRVEKTQGNSQRIFMEQVCRNWHLLVSLLADADLKSFSHSSFETESKIVKKT